MSTFIQLHLLTSYPPSNVNRDDLGRPKTAVVGGRTRLRIASQSLKRAWRTSDIFKSAVGDHIGKRTKRVGYEAAKKFDEAGIPRETAILWGKQISESFADTEPNDARDVFKQTLLKQPIHLSHIEYDKLDKLITKICQEKREPREDELSFLSKEHNAVDIAMFGRMVAVKGKQDMGLDGAVQVSHAFTVHEVAVEDDYFTAVDDLNEGPDAAHIGETEFAAGVFYLYICINRDLLVENLEKKDPEKAKDLSDKTLAALVEAAAKVAPTGHQNSFASRAYASYVLAERGEMQPRSLFTSFLEPVKNGNQLKEAIKRLEETRDNLDGVYNGWDEIETNEKDENGNKKVRKIAKSLPSKKLNALTGEGSLSDIISFIKE